MEKKRLGYLDMVKGVGIFFVVLGHISYISQSALYWIFSFHMPLFFIVSGFLIDIKDEPSGKLSETVRKKFRSIIIPYLWFSLAYFIIDILNIYVFKNADFNTLTVNLISSVTFYGVSVLWFLPALFLSEVSFMLILKRFGKVPALIIPIVLATAGYFANLKFFTPLYTAHADSLLITSLINFVRVFLRAFVGCVFVSCSYFIHRLAVKLCADFDRLSSVKARVLQFLAGVIMLAANVYVSRLNGGAGMQFLVLNNLIFYFLAAFLGALGIILICKALPSVKLIEYYGRNSLIVMACHINFYILYASLLVAFKAVSYVKYAQHFVFLSVTVIVVFMLCTVVIEVINRFLPFVLGKTYKKRN